MKNKVVSIIDVTLNVLKQLQKSQVAVVKISSSDLLLMVLTQ